MKSLTRFLERRLRLRVKEEKSAVARPWERKFLGYSLTWHRQSRLKVAASSVQRLKDKLREIFRRGRGRNLGQLIEAELTPLLRGWMNYFRLAEVKGIFDELDSWIRRKMRCVIWRQWKRTLARAQGLMKRGLKEVQAWESATNGRGPWWNAGASHNNWSLRLPLTAVNAARRKERDERSFRPALPYLKLRLVDQGKIDAAHDRTLLFVRLRIGDHQCQDIAACLGFS